MIRKSLALGILASATLALAACETPPVQRFPEITFQDRPALNLNAARIEVISQFRPAMQQPRVEHRFPTPPERALRRWAADRLKAGGRSGTIRFVIVDGAATETPLPKESGFTASMKVQQSARYDAGAEAMIEFVDDAGVVQRFTSTKVARSRTLAEDASINDREKLWFELTESLMRDFDREMEANVRRYLVNWLM